MSLVKICGLRRKEDIDAVNEAQPDYIGFVFAPSRRQINRQTAAFLKGRLDPRIKAVGVFVNENMQAVSEMAQNGIIDLIQLHGDEDEAYIRQVKETCGCPVIKSVGVGTALPALPLGADFLLFDAVSAQRGGVGKAFDWRVLQGYQDVPYFVAGGLSDENVADAIQRLAPFGVDVSSGVETNGYKDAEKIYKLVQLVRRMN